MLKIPIRKGRLYWVPDRAVRFVSNGPRSEHSRRPVLIVSSDEYNSDEERPHVQVCPVSSGHKSSKYDVPVKKFEGGLRTESWVRVEHSQAMLKSDLLDLLDLNGVSETVQQLVTANLAEILVFGNER